MKKLLILLGLVTLLAVFVTAIAADDALPNNPHVNPDANACYTGGALEGKCGDDPEMWTGGWYMIRFQYDLIGINQVPPAYQWMLPIPEPEADQVDVTPTKEPGCSDGLLPSGVPGRPPCDPCFSVLPGCFALDSRKAM